MKFMLSALRTVGRHMGQTWQAVPTRGTRDRLRRPYCESFSRFHFFPSPRLSNELWPSTGKRCLLAFRLIPTFNVIQPLSRLLMLFARSLLASSRVVLRRGQSQTVSHHQRPVTHSVTHSVTLKATQCHLDCHFDTSC